MKKIINSVHSLGENNMEKENIKRILEHEIYTTELFGETRFRALLGEFFEEGAFEDENKIDNTPFTELKTVKDVERLLLNI